MSTDKRALILRWIEERTRALADHNSRDGFCWHAQACCDVACGDDLGLALAALRAEATAHQPVDVPTGADDYLSICDACGCDYDDETPCPTIDRLFRSLGLQDSGR